MPSRNSKPRRGRWWCVVDKDGDLEVCRSERIARRMAKIWNDPKSWAFKVAPHEVIQVQEVPKRGKKKSKA